MLLFCAALLVPIRQTPVFPDIVARNEVLCTKLEKKKNNHSTSAPAWELLTPSTMRTAAERVVSESSFPLWSRLVVTEM